MPGEPMIENIGDSVIITETGAGRLQVEARTPTGAFLVMSRNRLGASARDRTLMICSARRSAPAPP
jgi:hypothetical protein